MATRRERLREILSQKRQGRADGKQMVRFFVWDMVAFRLRGYRAARRHHRPITERESITAEERTLMLSIRDTSIRLADSKGVPRDIIAVADAVLEMPTNEGAVHVQQWPRWTLHPEPVMAQFNAWWASDGSSWLDDPPA